MNDKIKDFVTNMGVLCELWTITYNNFVGQGLNAKDALFHTQGFMSALFTSITQNNGGK